MGTFFYFTAIFMFLLLCVILCAVILVQDSKNSGLGSSFGGDSNDSLFGTSTADVLKKFTAYLAFGFMIACMALNFWTEGMDRTHTSSTPSVVIEEASDN
ncbi:MAG: preprotein translocase subunit SecG [Parachlamydiales bacterium]|jgi:preprotein translocase subunit SecG